MSQLKVIKDPKLKLSGHTYWVRCVKWAPDGETFATASADRTVRLFNAAGEELFKVQHPDWVWHVCFAYSGKRKRIATACLDGIVRILDANSGRVVQEIKGHTGTVNCCAFSPDGELIVSTSYDKTSHVSNVNTGKLVRTLEGHNAPVLSVVVSPDGSKAYTACTSGVVRVSDIASGSLQASFQAHTGHVNCLALNSDGSLLASAGEDKVVHIWSKGASGAWEKQRSLQHADIVTCVSFTADDLVFGSSSADGQIRLFEAAGAWEEQARIKGHTDEVNWISFMSSGSRLTIASASDDNKACLWDASAVPVTIKVQRAKALKAAKAPASPTEQEASISVGDKTDMDGID